MKEIRQQQTDAGCIHPSTILLANGTNFDELRKHSDQESRTVSKHNSDCISKFLGAICPG
jgi:hypothetical protein